MKILVLGQQGVVSTTMVISCISVDLGEDRYHTTDFDIKELVRPEDPTIYGFAISKGN